MDKYKIMNEIEKLSKEDRLDLSNWLRAKISKELIDNVNKSISRISR